MFPQTAPYMLLQINVISARDLPPVSKTLRAYVVAWIDSGFKLTTRISHDGHANPTWNYKLLFEIGHRFLNSDSAAVEFEIYNGAWLRDVPIGTAKLRLNSFLPPLSAKNSSVRHAAMQIRRPTGQFHGTLNVTIQVIDNNAVETDVESDLSVSTLNKSPDYDDKEEEYEVSEENDEKISEQSNEVDIKREKSVRIVSEKGDGSPNLKNCPSFSASYVSGMHPLPSEVAADLKKGLCYFSGGETEYGSSIFENWSVPGENNSETKSKASKSVTWRTGDKLISVAGKDHGSSIVGSTATKKSRSSLKQHRRKSSEGGGLLSCFGNAYGFKFEMICGSNSMEEKKNKKTKKPSAIVDDF